MLRTAIHAGNPGRFPVRLVQLLAPVPRDVEEAVVGPSPDQRLLHGRLGDPENHSGVFHTDVVTREATGGTHSTPVVQCQVRADHLPALSAVSGAVNVLAAHIYGVVVVGGDVERCVPNEPIPDPDGRSPALLRPDLHASILAAILFIPYHDSTHHARTRRRGPDDVGIGGIGVAHPLSPPPTWCHIPRGIPRLPRRLLLGPR